MVNLGPRESQGRGVPGVDPPVVNDREPGLPEFPRADHPDSNPSQNSRSPSDQRPPPGLDEMFRTLAQVAPFGIVIVDPAERTEYLNPKFTEIFGYTLEDVPDVATWFRTAYPDEHQRQMAAVLWREQTSGLKRSDSPAIEIDPKLLLVRCKDATDKIVGFRAVLLGDGRIIATFLDVTGEVSVQKEIRRANKEWELTFDSVSDLIYILDNDQRIVRMNRAMADRLGIRDPAAIMGMPFEDLDRTERTLTSFPSSMGRSANGKERSSRIVGETSGAIFDVRMSPLIDESGQQVGSVYVARDVTALKSLEQARRRAVHHLSHELITPLSVIKGSVRKLVANELLPDQKQASLARIERNLDRLMEIQQTVKQIVSPRPYQPESLDVHQAVQQIVDELQQQSAHRSVHITSRLEPLRVEFMDPTVLRQVIQTLVKNAVENTPDGGKIEVSVASSLSGAMIEVQDSGVGISKRDQDFLFEGFHHTQPTDLYSTKTPFDFDAGGKGLELLRLRILSENGFFSISFRSRRCRHAWGAGNKCPGSVSLCPLVTDTKACAEAGGTSFSVVFPRHPKVAAGIGLLA